MLKVENGATKENISGEIDNILKDDFVKVLYPVNILTWHQE